MQVNVWPYYNAEKQFDAPFTSTEDQHDFFKRKVSVLNDISKLSFLKYIFNIYTLLNMDFVTSYSIQMNLWSVLIWKKKRRTKVFNWSEGHLYRVTLQNSYFTRTTIWPTFLSFSGLKGAYAWAQKEANNGSSREIERKIVVDRVSTYD